MREKMKLGVMQPYFFPYLGYWQLMNAVDRYVVYDDVNYINRGWINRNSILLNGSAHSINLILLRASQNKLINEIFVDGGQKTREKLLKTLHMAYANAPCYKQAMPHIESIIMQEEENLARYLYNSLEIVGSYLGIKTKLLLSSELEKDRSLKAHDRILDICNRLGATEYFNPINGIALYEPHRADFEKRGIQLKFLQMRPVVYKQYRNDFVPNLSIIDIMMFNSCEEISRMLGEYELQ